MIYLFILGVWIYFIFEGLTEGFTWNRLTKTTPKVYHTWRVFENTGILIAFYSWMIIHPGFLFFILVVISGLCLYEMAFSGYSYGNLLYNKTSKWLGIKHPKGYVWLIIFILSVGIVIKKIGG